MNILIIGHPGSGKTYLANLLSEKTGVEKIDTDVLFDRHPLYLFSKRFYKKALDKLLSNKDRWIVDGYHVGLMPDELIAKADVIIYLNLPKIELKHNIVSRYKSKKANKEFSHWQSKCINNLKNFGQIKFQDKSLKEDVARIKALVRNGATFVELKTRDEMKQFLHSFLVEIKLL